MDRIVHQQVSEAQKIQDAASLTSAPRSEVQIDTLQRECQVLTRYFIGQPPNGYIMSKYREAHNASDILRYHDTNPFDEFLLRTARMNSFATKLVDTYTAVFRKRTIFRKKAVLLLAILESGSPTYAHFDVPDFSGSVSLLTGLVQRATTFVLFLVPLTLLLFPIQLAYIILPKFFSLPKTARETR